MPVEVDKVHKGLVITHRWAAKLTGLQTLPDWVWQAADRHRAHPKTCCALGVTSIALLP